MKQPSGGCGDAPNLRVFPNGQEGYPYEILSQEGKSDCSYAPNSSLEYSAFLEKVTFWDFSAHAGNEEGA